MLSYALVGTSRNREMMHNVTKEAFNLGLGGGKAEGAHVTFATGLSPQHCPFECFKRFLCCWISSQLLPYDLHIDFNTEQCFPRGSCEVTSIYLSLGKEKLLTKVSRQQVFLFTCNAGNRGMKRTFIIVQCDQY